MFAMFTTLPTYAANVRCVIVEIYVSDSTPRSEIALAAARQVAESRAGMVLTVRSVDDAENASNALRLEKIAAHYRIAARTPLIYACNRVISSGVDAADFQRQLTDALTIEVFTRRGCQRCVRAKAYMPSLTAEFPGMEVVYRELVGNAQHQQMLNRLVQKHGVAAASTPVTHICNSIVVGFDRPETTGARWRQKLQRWTIACPAPPQAAGKTLRSGEGFQTTRVDAATEFQEESKVVDAVGPRFVGGEVAHHPPF